MTCRSCNQIAYRVQTTFTSEGPKDKCTNCGLNKGVWVPDVAYPYGSGEHTEENIAYPRGHEKEGQPIPFSSRRGKAEAMRIAGIREAGDRSHGAPSQFH